MTSVGYANLSCMRASVVFTALIAVTNAYAGGPEAAVTSTPPVEKAPPDAEAPSYPALMKLSFEKRKSYLMTLNPAQRISFMNSLPGPQRAVVATDIEDCGGFARQTRFLIAVSGDSYDPDAAPKPAEESRGWLRRLFVPNVVERALFASKLPGTVSERVDQEIKTHKAIVAYRDVCDLPAEARTHLLLADDATPTAVPANEPN